MTSSILLRSCGFGFINLVNDSADYLTSLIPLKDNAGLKTAIKIALWALILHQASATVLEVSAQAIRCFGIINTTLFE